MGISVDKAEAQSQSTVGCSDCPVSVSNPLRIRSFGWNGQTYTFGDTLSPSAGLEIDTRIAPGIFRGWSWQGGMASYVILDVNTGGNILVVRPFDGQNFGSVVSSQTVSGRDVFRGWSWNGTYASYVTVDGNGRSTLTVRPFDSRTFKLGSVVSSQTVSDRDVFQGWSWDGSVASYVTKQ